MLIELIRSEDLFTSVKDGLKRLNKMDLDKLISAVRAVSFSSVITLSVHIQLASSETRETNTARMASNRVAQMLSLRNLVKNLPLLEKALLGARSELLQIIHHVNYPPSRFNKPLLTYYGIPSYWRMIAYLRSRRW